MNLWRTYVNWLLQQSGKRESEFLVGKSVHQGTFNRWKTGAVIPDKAAPVAQFARDCGRNPLEAFVAAGMLPTEEAGRGLAESERQFLSMLQEYVSRTEWEGPLRALPDLSAAPGTTQGAVAAHEDGDIAGEQEASQEP